MLPSPNVIQSIPPYILALPFTIALDVTGSISAP